MPIIDDQSPTPQRAILLSISISKRAPSEIKTAVTRAFYDAPGSGAEFIPDQFRAELYETFQVPRNLRALMPSVEMQSNTMIIPRMGRGGRPYVKGQVSNDNPASYHASQILTESKTIAVKGFATRYLVGRWRSRRFSACTNANLNPSNCLRS